MADSNKESAKDLIQRASSKMHSSYTSYRVWKWLEVARNINIGEDKVKKNLAVMNHYKAFFHTALQGAFYSFVIDLSVFFDRHKHALSLDALISEVEPSDAVMQEIEKLRASQEKNISMLKTLRDKDIAHVDVNFDRSQTARIIYQDVEDLFSTVQKIFDLISQAFDRSFWAWEHLDEVDNEMLYLIDNLERGEQKRIDDINMEV